MCVYEKVLPKAITSS